MTVAPTISVVICTHNRAAALRETLASLAKVRTRPEWKAELLVVDNASNDDTAAVVRAVQLPNLAVNYYFEARKGKSNALNSALARTRGELILFTDDDVAIAEDWMEQMVAAFAQQGCDALVGKITLASNLIRPWMNRRHFWWLAAPDAQPAATPELIGANMGFRRAVLQRVAGYDPELGPGALGLGEESLFGGQLKAAGFKIGYAESAAVVHSPDPSRLKRRDWIDLARKHGRQEAYIEYHWHHHDVSLLPVRRVLSALKLAIRRIAQPPSPLDAEGCPDWEMCYVRDLERLCQMGVECLRPRNYTLHGLVKMGGQSSSDAALVGESALVAGKAASR